MALSAWGTSNMRTGGDDLAQALALMGVRPKWEPSSGRVTGFEILPLDLLDRPRVDVTLRVSGFFRDAFPAQIALLDAAVRAVARLEESERDNPLAAAWGADAARLAAAGTPRSEAERRAGYRIFGSRPGTYGAGLQALIDERGWREEADPRPRLDPVGRLRLRRGGRRARPSTPSSSGASGGWKRWCTTRTTASTTSSTPTTTTSSRAG